MTHPDVIVIGGGIVGLITAINLAAEGATVTIIDAGQNAGSTANAGSLHVQMQSRFMRLYPDQVPNIEASLPFYRVAVDEWVKLDQLQGPFELVQKGGLMLAETSDQLRFLEKKAARERRQGLNIEILDRLDLDRIAPWISSDIVGAELCLDEGKLNPLVANNRLRSRANELGISFITDSVRSLSVSGAFVTASGSLGDYRASRAVVAAAWGSGPIVDGLGVSIPTRAEPLHMNITEACAAQINHLIQHAERSITLKQFSSGQIVIGGGWAAGGRGSYVVPQVLPESLLGNVALAARLVPSIGGMRVIRTWAGMNTTVDGASVIGPLPKTDRIVMAIPGDAGYTLGPLVARIASAMVLGSPAPVDPAQFSPARFAR